MFYMKYLARDWCTASGDPRSAVLQKKDGCLAGKEITGRTTARERSGKIVSF